MRPIKIRVLAMPNGKAKVCSGFAINRYLDMSRI